MITLLEIADRARSGLKMEPKEWELKLFRKMQALSKEYNIKCPPPGEFLNTDNVIADVAFEAGLKFVVENGAFCISTNRVIRFTEEEVIEAIKAAPREIIMGEGKDTRVFKQHPIEGKNPINICPGHHAPFDEELGRLVVKNFAQIPRGDFLEGFNFTKVDDVEIFGPPTEAYATRREVAYLRDGIRKAGRPGMAILLYPITTRASSFLAAIDPEVGLRKTDGVLFSVLPDVKIEYDLLTAAMVYQDYGYFAVSGSFGMAGGFCGGPEGAIIESVAKCIVGWMTYRDNIHYPGVEHIASISGEKMMFHPLNWARSVVYQALNRNSNIVYMEWNIPASELCTEEHLLESAIRSIEAPLNGANLYAPRVSRPRMNAGQTPLEPEFMIEVSDATIKAGLKRGEASRLLQKISGGLEGKTPAKGKTILECYDLVKHKPSKEYEEICRKVKKMLVNFGLKFE